MSPEKLNQLNMLFDRVVLTNTTIFKFKYICRNLDCHISVRSNTALSKDQQFCLHCIK